MAPTVFVDIWSDVVCPFCYLGFRQFHDALQKFEAAQYVVVRHHAFELDPHAPVDFSGTLNEMLAAKYSLSLERASALNRAVEENANALGLQWSRDRARPTNTFDAHRLIALAAQQGRQSEMLERLFRAYFSEGLLVSDPDTLTTLALETGVESASSMLAGRDLADSVRHDENLAAEIGVNGVPALIVAGRVNISGAQGAHTMLAALRQVWSERSELPT